VAIGTIAAPELVIIGLLAGTVVAINYAAEYAKQLFLTKGKNRILV
jgi:hypothetical protein